MQRIIITGGTGFIGRSLARFLTERDCQPVIIARHQPEAGFPYEFHAWDAVELGDWATALEGSTAIVNLAGRTVDCIKTPDNADVILRSRVDSTMVIGRALRTLNEPPPVWVQMSTAHIYGDPPRQVCTEESTLGYGLAPFVGKAWEAALMESLPESTREVRLRTSFVIGRNGGALASLVRIARMGLGGKVGHGRQGFSWIHEDDLNSLIYQSIINPDYKGVYIASAPNPVSNEVFMHTLRRQLRVPVGLPTPAWMARLGAHYVFRTDPELALFGRYVHPARLLLEGFSFRFPELEGALGDLLSKE